MRHPLFKEDVLLPKEFAVRVGVCKATVHDWLHANKLVSYRLGKRWFIPASELERLSKANELVTPDR